jgi:hypothetical protein
MSKTVRLSERDLTRLIKRVINEQPTGEAPTGMGPSEPGCKKPTNRPCSEGGLKNLNGMIVPFGNGITKFIVMNQQTGCPESCIMDKNGKDVFKYIGIK